MSLDDEGEIVFPIVNSNKEEEVDSNNICFSYPWAEVSLSGIFGLLVGLLLASYQGVSESIERGRIWLIALASIVLIALVALIINKFNILGDAYKEYYGAGVIVLIIAVVVLVGAGVYQFANKGVDKRQTRFFNQEF